MTKELITCSCNIWCIVRPPRRFGAKMSRVQSIWAPPIMASSVCLHLGSTTSSFSCTASVDTECFHNTLKWQTANLTSLDGEFQSDLTVIVRWCRLAHGQPKPTYAHLLVYQSSSDKCRLQAGSSGVGTFFHYYRVIQKPTLRTSVHDKM